MDKIIFCFLIVAMLGCVSAPKPEPKPIPVAEAVEQVSEPVLVAEPDPVPTQKMKVGGRVEIIWPDVATGVLQHQAAMDEFWKTYDRGLESVFETYETLYNRMGWARVEVDSQITAVTSGEFVAFFAIYDPKSPALEKWFPSYRVDQPANHFVVMIRPEQISKAWIPAFLIHEMSHVVVRLNKKLTDKTLDEAAAYSIEKLALNATTKNGVDRELDQVLAEYKIKNESEILALPKGKLFSRLAASDLKLFEKPKSYAEGEMRMGFYSIALGFRFVERQKISAKSQKDRQFNYLKKFLAKNSKTI